jgi:hypothetical protein
VMNYFIIKKFTSQVSFHHEAMFHFV